MPSELDEEEIRDILETYDETGSKSKTADVSDHSRGTVRKYVDKYYEDWKDDHTTTSVGGGGTDPSQDAAEMTTTTDDGHVTDSLSSGPEVEPATGPGPGDTMDDTDDDPDDGQPAFTSTPPSETPMGAPEKPSDPQSGNEDPDLASMGYGEFIEWFFSQQGHGVRQDFADIMSQRCRLKQELPDEQSMKYSILNAASGVNNDFNAQMIAENYWAVAERYLRENEQASHPDGQQQGPHPSGEWVGNGQGGQQVQQQQSQQPDGEWVSPQETETAPWESSPSPRRPRVADQNRWMGSEQDDGQQDGRSDEKVEALAEAVKGMHDTQQKIMQELSSDKDEDRPLHQQMRELRQARDEIQALTGDNDDSDDQIKELVNHFQTEMDRLEAKVQDQNQQQVPQGEGSDLMALAQLANNDNVDADTLSTIAEVGGVTDPEVKKAEFDLKKEERKSENRKEMIDSIFDNAGDLVEGATEMGLDKLLGGDGGGNSQQQPPQQTNGDQPPETRVAEDQQRHRVQERQRHDDQPQDNGPSGEVGDMDSGYYGSNSGGGGGGAPSTGGNRDRYEELAAEAEESEEGSELPDSFEEFAEGDE